ncbi:hypothetical protein EDB85DRAFT_1433016 [Lactarius pseudohatsudake]|nr:hypothetical protein EDB85DRAFT_1433016 [Lactarius pseudohatsudake]
MIDAQSGIDPRTEEGAAQRLREAWTQENSNNSNGYLERILGSRLHHPRTVPQGCRIVAGCGFILFQSRVRREWLTPSSATRASTPKQLTSFFLQTLAKGMDNAIQTGRLIRCLYSNPRSISFALTFSLSPRFISDSFFSLIPPCRLPRVPPLCRHRALPSIRLHAACRAPPLPSCCSFLPHGLSAHHISSRIACTLPPPALPCALPARRICCCRPSPHVACTPAAGFAPCAAHLLPSPALLRACLYPPAAGFAPCAACLLAAGFVPRVAVPAAGFAPCVACLLSSPALPVRRRTLPPPALPCALRIYSHRRLCPARRWTLPPPALPRALRVYSHRRLCPVRRRTLPLPALPVRCASALIAGFSPRVAVPSRRRLFPVRCVSTHRRLCPVRRRTLPPPALPRALRVCSRRRPCPSRRLHPPTAVFAPCAAHLLPSPALPRASLYPPAAGLAPCAARLLPSLALPRASPYPPTAGFAPCAALLLLSPALPCVSLACDMPYPPLLPAPATTPVLNCAVSPTCGGAASAGISAGPDRAGGPGCSSRLSAGGPQL